jgi:formylglycine-generating enzyme required for sulfatase activity
MRTTALLPLLLLAVLSTSAQFGSSRGLRGGSWDDYEGSLRASDRDGVGSPAYEGSDIGFRVATVPEPTVAVSLLMTGAWLLSRRKRPSAL